MSTLLSLPILSQVAVLFAISCATSFVLMFAIRAIFTRVGFLDNPAPYGHDRAPVPFSAGVIFFINFLILSSILIPLMTEGNKEKLFIVLILGAIVTLVSFVDDLDTIFKFDRAAKCDVKRTPEELGKIRKKTPFEVPAKVRLAMQVLVGAVIGLTSIKIGYISNIFGWVLYLDQYYIVLGSIKVFLIPLLFTVAWYVLVFNSLNWSDGIPGLTPGLSLISLATIAILTIKLYLIDPTNPSQENARLVLLSLAVLIPSVAVAWAYNLRPHVLLGDSGTMFLAFMIATLAIVAGGKIATVATVLGVYLIDAFYVILMRLYNKQSPLSGDRIHHLHYRLMNMGLSENFVRLFVYVLALLFGLAAIFLDKTGKIILFAVLFVIVVFITKILSLKK